MIVLVMVVIVGLSAGIAGSTWKPVTQRALEEQLLWVGEQYRKTIESYYKKAHAGLQAAYPNSIQDLVRDPRTAEALHHIRRICPNPITGEDFELLKDPGGRIKGVRSTSKDEPFKKNGFPAEYKSFNNADRYRQWEFVYVPPLPKLRLLIPPTHPPGNQSSDPPEAPPGLFF